MPEFLVFCMVTLVVLWLSDRVLLRSVKSDLSRFFFSLLTGLVTAVIVVSGLNAASDRPAEKPTPQVSTPAQSAAPAAEFAAPAVGVPPGPRR